MNGLVLLIGTLTTLVVSCTSLMGGVYATLKMLKEMRESHHYIRKIHDASEKGGNDGGDESAG